MLFHKIMANQYLEMWFSEACNIIVPVSVTHYKKSFVAVVCLRFLIAQVQKMIYIKKIT